MWIKTENGEKRKPEELEMTANHAILRRDFKLVPATDNMEEHYVYEEWQMTRDQYEVYKNFETLVNEQSDALVELAEILSEVM